MTCIIKNQKSKNAVEAGTAFRFAYRKSKMWKKGIWAITFVFALFQAGVSAYVFSFGRLSVDLTPYVVGFLLASVIAGSFGKTMVTKWQTLGCTLQRRHDFLVMGIGVNPTSIELPKSKIVELSNKQLITTPKDKEELESWWSTALNTVPFPVAKVIATYSTFTWERELRKQYNTLVSWILLFSVVCPLVLALTLDYTISETIIFIYAPFTPFISVVLDEWLANKQSLKVAESLTIECNTTWLNIKAKKLTVQEIGSATEQQMNFWQTFRQSATPIFEWLYKRSQKKMEMDMTINADELIDEYLS